MKIADLEKLTRFTNVAVGMSSRRAINPSKELTLPDRTGTCYCKT